MKENTFEDISCLDIIKDMPLGFALIKEITDENGESEYAFMKINKAFQKIIGDVKKGKTLNQLLSEDDKSLCQFYEKLDKALKRVNNHNDKPEIQFYSYTLSKWLWLNTYSINSNHYSVLIKDITERRNNELAMEKSEERLDKIKIELQQANEELRETLLRLKESNQELEELTQEKEINNDQLRTANKEYKTSNENLSKTNKNLEIANEELKTIYDKIEIANQNLKQMNKGLKETNQGLWDTNQGLWYANDQLEDDKKSLLDRNKELKQSNAIVSHDLKSPLNVIMSYINIIQRRYHDVMDIKEKDFTNMVKEKAQSMINFIEELMSVNNNDEDKYVQNTVWDIHNLEEIIQIAQENLKLEIEKVKPELILPISFPRIYADKNLLVSLFQNLISNAIKYRKKDVNLRIEIVVKDYDPTTWLFSVSDNGIGIDKEKHESIFDLYNRVDNDLTAGHGIGLSFCRKIVKQYSGKIWVDSTPGIGSTFLFTLPKIDGGDGKINTKVKSQNI